MASALENTLTLVGLASMFRDERGNDSKVQWGRAAAFVLFYAAAAWKVMQRV